jgi:hypothetical protein
MCVHKFNNKFAKKNVQENDRRQMPISINLCKKKIELICAFY